MIHDSDGLLCDHNRLFHSCDGLFRGCDRLLDKMLLWGAWPESNVEASHVEKFAAEIRGSQKTIAGFPPDSI